jgi:Na+/H+ antiporter NhaD/arsenite permease-like protein
MSDQSHAHPASSASTTRVRLFNTIGCTIVIIIALIGLFSGDHGESHESDTHAEMVDTPEATISLEEGIATDTVEKELPPLWQLGTIPFILMLLSIAVLPLVGKTHHWWEFNRNKLLVALGLTFLTILYYLIFVGPASVAGALEHAIPGEYVPFMMLLFTLYVISGGINVSGDLRATPLTNSTFILIGTLIASFIGTTGASMLLIRPLLQTNAERKHRVHTVVFFIFLVSNIGGSLLPIGDPPLFLGYLKGVPFLWTFNLFVEWLAMSIVLLVIYFIWDSWAYSKEEKKDIIADDVIRKPLRITGLVNFLLLAGIVFCVALLDPSKPIPGTDYYPFLFLREFLMLALAGLSLVLTPRGVREANRFSYFAIIEVAVIFIGIFITMQVPLEVLKLQGDQLGLTTPWHYFWATGILSSFLDNAPTYLVFFQTAESLSQSPGEGILTLVGGEFIREDLLVAISLGAVFMGANTYIGNGPNFMVKAIAEQEGVRMPSFFGYMFYSGLILIPLFIVVTFVFIH